MALKDLIQAGRIDNAYNPNNNKYSNAFEFNSNSGAFPAWEDCYLTMTAHNMDGNGVRTDYNITKKSGNSIYPLIILIYKGSEELYFPNYYPLPLQPCIAWQTFDYEWNTDIATGWPWAVRSGRFSTLYNSNDILLPPLAISNLAANPMFYTTSLQDNSAYVEIDTNIPIIAIDFDNVGDWNTDPGNVPYILGQYMSGGGDMDQLMEDLAQYIEDEFIFFVNYDTSPIEPRSNLFTIYNTGQLDRWTNAGRSFISGPYYRWARLKLATSDQVDGRFAFYRGGLDDGKIKLIPVSVASVVNCEYSTDGGATWQESGSFPYDYIYGERVDELGEFISATRTGIGGNTGVPLFATEAEAIGWVNHDPNVSIDQALNYGELGNRYPITNPTGIDETSTTMGTNAGIASLFSQKYLCNKSDIEKIARALFDTGAGHIWDDIKEGLDMMGENPINAVCGLQYFPIDLSQVFSRTSSQSSIYFGGYYFKPTDHGEQSDLNILKILGFDGFVDLGEFTIERSFTPAEDIRNYEPYCNLQIFLPYVGLQKLSYNKYVGKTIKARYYIDINSGGCLACLFCNNILMDFFNGNMGVNLPITLTDFAGYAEAQLNNLASFAGVGGNAAGAISAGASGNIAGAAGASVASIAGFEKSLYEVSTTNLDQFNTTKGGSSALGNGYLPQYIYLVFEFIQTDETPNLIQLAGRASNASGVLNSFSGYLEIDDIELKTSAGMTESEKAEFISLLHSGIII